MDKKYDKKDYENMTYDEVHALLVEVMQDACTSDEAGPYRSPSVDLSFLDEETEEKTRKRRCSFRFNKVAAILIIVLLGMNVVMLATGSGVTYSENGLLHRIYEGARGIFTDEDESQYVELYETGKVFVITDITKINDAKKFWTDLCVPEYIPEGYEFKKLIIKKEVSGDYWAQYEFKKNGEFVNVTILSSENDMGYISKNIGHAVELSDRIINIYFDKTFGHLVADIYFEEITVSISGSTVKSELYDISYGIEYK